MLRSRRQLTKLRGAIAAKTAKAMAIVNDFETPNITRKVSRVTATVTA